MRIEIADLFRMQPVGNVEDAQAADVVRLIHRVADQPEVVVGRLVLGDILAAEDRVLEIADVPDQRPGAVDKSLDLVQLVIFVRVAMVVGEPSLVRVADVGIRRARDRDGMRLVRHVRDRQVRLVPPETDLMPLVLHGRPVIDDALRIVRIAGALPAGLRIGEAAGELGMLRIVHVHHMQAAAAHLAAGVGARQVDEAARGIGDDVVDAVRHAVVRVLGERLRRAHTAQPVQIEDLHAVIARAIGYDERIVLVGLDLAPERARRCGGLRQIAQVDGTTGVGDVHERRPVDTTDDRDGLPRDRIVVAPDVAQLHAALAPDRRHRQE